MIRLLLTAARGLVRSLTSVETTKALLFPFMPNQRLRNGVPATTLKQAHNILLIRLDLIGDLILTWPFLRELRRNAPTAWITLVVAEGTEDVVELCPYVNEILTYDTRVARRLSRFQRQYRAIAVALRSFRHRDYDLAIVPRLFADTFHSPYLALVTLHFGHPAKQRYP
jgi:heptosyltransferase-2